MLGKPATVPRPLPAAQALHPCLHSPGDSHPLRARGLGVGLSQLPVSGHILSITVTPYGGSNGPTQEACPPTATLPVQPSPRPTWNPAPRSWVVPRAPRRGQQVLWTRLPPLLGRRAAHCPDAASLRGPGQSVGCSYPAAGRRARPGLPGTRHSLTTHLLSSCSLNVCPSRLARLPAQAWHRVPMCSNRTEALGRLPMCSKCWNLARAPLYCGPAARRTREF